MRWQDRGYAFPTDDDHVWSELVTLEDTPDAATLDLSAAQFAERFTHVGYWDVL
jgi:hypothetical protein